MRKYAFTLIELLVVIAIIGILAGLAASTFGMVRTMAQSTNCLNNLRNMQLANMAYAQENRGYFVTVYYFIKSPAEQKLNPWRSNKAFLAFFTDDGVTNGNGNKVSSKLLCPTVRHAVPPNNDYTKLELSYGYNTQNPWRTAGPVGPTTRTPGVGTLIMFLDALDWEISNIWEINNDYLTKSNIVEGAFAGQTVAFRHRKNANVVLGDGSAFARNYQVLRERWPRKSNGFIRYWAPSHLDPQGPP